MGNIKIKENVAANIYKRATEKPGMVEKYILVYTVFAVGINMPDKKGVNRPQRETNIDGDHS